jgi:site-specific recombinase
MASIEVPLPSNRKFGMLFFVVFGLLAGYTGWRGRPAFPYFLGLSLAFLLVALAAPGLLRPLNRAWMAFAGLLHKVTSPIILGVMFFVLFTPVGLVMRLRRRDLMRRQFDRKADSYWIPRVPPGPPGPTLRNQY